MGSSIQLSGPMGRFGITTTKDTATSPNPISRSVSGHNLRPLKRKRDLEGTKRVPKHKMFHKNLPNYAVQLLRNWMFMNFLHPYPNDVVKKRLASEAGITLRQLGYWFVNARAR